MKRVFCIAVIISIFIGADTRAEKSFDFTRAQPNFLTDTAISVGETLTIKSKSLNEDREIRVYFPGSYQNSKRKYPVIYTLDGEGTGLITAAAARFMTEYSAIPQMPEALVVAVVNTNRNRDMPIPEGYGKAGEEKFLAFLAEELIPAVEQKYRAEPLRILLGHSQGGLFAHYAITQRPSAFQWILSIDAPLAGFSPVAPVMEKVKAAAKNPNSRGRLVSIENLYGWRKQWSALTATAQKNFYAAQIEIKDETHETMAYKGVYEGLKSLFHDYAPNLVRLNKQIYTLPELEKQYKDLSESYGYQVEIPKQVLLISADQNIAVQHGIEAVALVKHAAAIYGESFPIERRMKEAEEAVKKGRNPKFEEWANLPPPTLDSMKMFIGTWERVDEATWIIAFEAEDGLVRAQNTVIPPNFEPFHLEVNFVRVLEGGKLQWGERNGRGPGVTVYTATLVDKGTLAGTAEQVGFIMQRPPFTFTYKRRPNDKK
jgi:predicted alpha/beta superfamily hydrolase